RLVLHLRLVVGDFLDRVVETPRQEERSEQRRDDGVAQRHGTSEQFHAARPPAGKSSDYLSLPPPIRQLRAPSQALSPTSLAGPKRNAPPPASGGGQEPQAWSDRQACRLTASGSPWPCSATARKSPGCWCRPARRPSGTA